MNKLLMHKERMIESLTNNTDSNNQENIKDMIKQLKNYEIEDWILQLIENEKLLSHLKIYGEDNIISIESSRPVYIRKYLNKFVLDMSYDNIYNLHEYGKTITNIYELESFIKQLLKDIK